MRMKVLAAIEKQPFKIGSHVTYSHREAKELHGVGVLREYGTNAIILESNESSTGKIVLHEGYDIGVCYTADDFKCPTDCVYRKDYVGRVISPGGGRLFYYCKLSCANYDRASIEHMGTNSCYLNYHEINSHNDLQYWKARYECLLKDNLPVPSWLEEYYQLALKEQPKPKIGKQKEVTLFDFEF